MRRQIIERAERRFDSAKEALADMSGRQVFAELALDWTRFLNAIDDGLSKLISGAEADAAGRRWCNEKARERRVDPLLCYLREARNAPEHGLLLAGIEDEQPPAKLVRIYNSRSRTWYEVPTSHLGVNVLEVTPLSAAELALKYLGAMIVECRGD